MHKLSQRILGETARLTRFVENLLETARLDAGTRRITRQQIALADLVAEAADEVRGRYPEVQIEVQAERGLLLMADPMGTRAVIQNLIDNACKSVKAGANGKGHVRVHLQRAEDRARLLVADNGMGFDPAERERIFQRFYRVGDELTRKTKGSGLGLYIARSAVEAEGGRMWAESDGPGLGARFHVLWPLFRGEAAA
ncbi:MAG: ATP-binding protein [Planctomycetota bacterium]